MSLGSQRFCLRWNNHQSNLLSVFDQLLHDEAFVDVTLAVEGQFLRAHKMVLSACSPYFQTLFVGHPDKHPIVILKDVPYADMRSLLDFMYRGEVSVDQDRLTAFLKVAESLRIKGLTEVNEERCDLPSIASSLLSSTPPNQTAAPQTPQPPPPPPHLHRIHHVPQPHKRSLPPMAANPLLGSALTAPKRKRGRPRKLSGSDQPNSNGQEQEDRPDQTSRAESPVLHTTAPELLEVNMCEIQHSPSGANGSSPVTQSQHSKDTQQDSNGDSKTTEDVPDDRPPGGATPVKKEPSEDREPTPSTSMHSGTTDGERCPSGGNSSVEHPSISCTKVKIEDVPAVISEANNNKNDLNRTLDDADECYEDMIACSPASCGSEREDQDRDRNDDADDDYGDDEEESEDNEGKLSFRKRAMNLSMDRPDMSLVIKQEKDYHRNDSDFLDEDISQYEMDSFRSMMASYGTNIMNTPTQIIPRLSITPTSPTMTAPASMISTAIGGDRFSRNRPIDKASVRRYCTHEADNVYRCNVCAKTYTHISNFCRHFLSAHHGVRQEIPCPVCFKLFTRKDNMMTHTKQVHRLTIVRGSGGNITTAPAIPPLSHDSTSTPNLSQEQLLLAPHQQQHSTPVSSVGNISRPQQYHHSTANDSS